MLFCYIVQKLKNVSIFFYDVVCNPREIQPDYKF